MTDPSEAPQAALNLRLEVGCMNNLLWRVDLPADVDAAEATRRLVAGPWELGRQVHGIVYFEDPLGHQLVLVERTGRLQLRLSYMFAPELRERVAVVVAEALERLLASRAG